MVNFSILISSSEVNGPGGLFDIDATLPLVAIQFVLLMVILNALLYSPLLTIIEERKEYILNKLAKASEVLSQANELTAQYEQELSSVRKEAQLEIANSQKIHKEILEIELNISQKYIDNLLETITEDLLDKKTTALNSLDTIVQSLCVEVENRLSI
uniref:ATP synthase subunit b', chloroplastic n=1 Tax=Pseudictyota dubia TaxID=2749911 RepID=A0A2U9NR45_9STRA|nr:ATP synthase CF0 B' subunit [Pseudictyota dubia]AWT39512.1 ATP synthase CF0 B' subunit [Pseudictyota dubia]